MSDDDCSISGTPPELTEAVNTASLDLLPKKSKENKIISVENIKQTNHTSSNVLPMFNTCTNCQITVNISNN